MPGAFDISASALYAQRVRMDSIAENLANANTTHGVDGKIAPYRRKFVIFETGDPATGNPTEGVHVSEIRSDMTAAFRREFDPNNEDAVKDPTSHDFGYVLYPNVNPLVEMINMIDATRAYEMNATAIEATKTMGQATDRILA